MKSAMAEENILAMVLKVPALLDQTKDLKGSVFSSPLLGNAYDQLRRRHEEGLEVSVAVLTDFSPEEMSHLAGILHRNQGPVSDKALKDCVQTILAEHQSGTVQTEDDLLKIRERMKERKGIKA
jgi:hypothetical protein